MIAWRNGIATVALFASATPGIAQEVRLDPRRAGTPVLTGVPVRSLTDPQSLVSPVKSEAGPVPISDLFFTRSSWFATWTPDGQVVLATDITGRTNLWRMPGAGGFPLQLQQSEDKTFYPAGTPDGKTILYASDIGGREIYDLYAIPAEGGAAVNLSASPDASDTGPFAISGDSRLVAFNRRVASEPSTNVAALTIADGKTRLLTNEAEAGTYWYVLAFSPDGGSVYANRGNAGMTESSVWRIDVDSGAATRIAGGTPAQPYESASALSPDGKTLTLTSENAAGLHQAVLLDLATGARTPIKPGDWPQTASGFSPDGKSVLAIANVDGRDEVYEYTLATRSVRRLPLPEGRVSDYFASLPAFSPDGTRLLFPHSSGGAPFDYWTHDLAKGTTQRLTRLSLASIDPESLPRTSVVSYKSADGTVISAILWMPWTLKRVGSARMPDVWAAGVEDSGIVNWNTMWERGSPALREYQRGLIGDPEKDKAVYARVSPLTYLRNTQAPLLVLQGANDIRVPAHEATQIVDVLKEAGRIVDSKVYAEEGHGFAKRENQIDAAERTVAWFDKYLKGSNDAP